MKFTLRNILLMLVGLSLPFVAITVLAIAVSFPGIAITIILLMFGSMAGISLLDNYGDE